MVLVKSKFSMRFGGVELMQWIDGVTNIDRNIGQNRTASLLKVAHTNGELFQYTTASHGTITVTALIYTDIQRRELARALMSDEPQQLIFGDEPDKYYQAIVDGQSTVAEAYYNNVLTITFIVPDGIAHSVATQTADNMPYKDVPVNLLKNTGTTSATSNTVAWGTLFASSQIYDSEIKYLSGVSAMTFSFNVYVPLNAETGNKITIQLKGQNHQATDVRPDDLNTLLGSCNYVIKQSDLGKTIRLDVPVQKDYKYQSFDTALADTDSITIRQENSVQGFVYSKIKLETSSAATPWSPNPADPEYYSDTITVHNGGTYPVYPVIEATMHGDNGLVAFVNDQGGVLQFGDPEEIDGEIRQKSERMLSESYDHAPAVVTYNNAATNYPNYLGDPTKPNSQRGIIGYADTVGLDPSKGSGATPTFTNGDSGYWGGPSYQLAIKPNSNNTNAGNFLMKTRFYFATSVKQTGRLEITLQSADKVAYSAVIRDSDASKDEIDVEFWVQSKCMDSFALNRKNYNNGMYRELVIGKLGSKITIQIGAVIDVKADNTSDVRSTVIKNYQLDYMADVPVTTYSVWFERMRNMNHVMMDVTDTQFSWVNVDYWQDLPNRWKDGDVITADVANKSIYVNGVEDMTLHTVGNQWDSFMLQPGENTIEAIRSSWCTTPLDVSVQYREAYY